MSRIFDTSFNKSVQLFLFTTFFLALPTVHCETFTIHRLDSGITTALSNSDQGRILRDQLNSRYACHSLAGFNCPLTNGKPRDPATPLLSDMVETVLSHSVKARGDGVPVRHSLTKELREEWPTSTTSSSPISTFTRKKIPSQPTPKNIQTNSETKSTPTSNHASGTKSQQPQQHQQGNPQHADELDSEVASLLSAATLRSSSTNDDDSSHIELLTHDGQTISIDLSGGGGGASSLFDSGDSLGGSNDGIVEVEEVFFVDEHGNQVGERMTMAQMKQLLHSQGLDTNELDDLSSSTSTSTPSSSSPNQRTVAEEAAATSGSTDEEVIASEVAAQLLDLLLGLQSQRQRQVQQQEQGDVTQQQQHQQQEVPATKLKIFHFGREDEIREQYKQNTHNPQQQDEEEN